jgi:hypothetical protein
VHDIPKIEIDEEGYKRPYSDLEFECHVVGDHIMKANSQRLLQCKHKVNASSDSLF